MARYQKLLECQYLRKTDPHCDRKRAGETAPSHRNYLRRLI
ncbi:hypothetical protein COO91_10901 (plasmid) [Nostoc flagelliforme CCNUN1]|uniref:Uncharacterized protein n=1 Tax=Nostoc flagelliforme CCNUN1 TaxID=2038116 RepID=A0A2K8TAP8_9NOSO|nr:hypothetical protein COO91_10901 [Nostoc flagelliforme CCNUN1]